MRKPATRWWWIRHAPVADANGRLYGQMDLGCDTGDRSAFRALARIVPRQAVGLVTPLRRTLETYRAIADAGGILPDPLTEPAFIEQHFGRWQGLTWTSMEAEDSEAYAWFWEDPTRRRPPEGESFVDVIERTREGLKRLNRRFEGEDLVVVGHGGSIRAALAVALDLTPVAAMAVVIDNLSITRLRFVEDGLLRARGGVWQVDGVNMPCRWIP